MKKKVFLVQPGYIYGDEKKTAYLPYAAGTIAAYAFSQESIRENYLFGGFLCFFEEDAAALDKIKDADVVGFSNYVWNYKYNCALAAKLRRENPRCTIIFGGHQIAPGEAPVQLRPYVDFLVFGEGETGFAGLLDELAGDRRFENVGGIAYRAADGKIMHTAERPCGNVELPSPYLTGFFDSLLKERPDISFTALFETNRGCPFHCAYCDWGTTKTRMRLFPMERIRDEIRWFSDHKIESCFAADSNFGMFPRDEQIADMLKEAALTTGFPKHFDVTYAKSDSPRVHKIASALFREGLSNGPAISFQSMNPATLRAIGRENMPPDTFVKVLKQYEESGMRPYSELILGLPEETYDSFTKGIGTLLALGQHSYLDIFRCEILSNSRLADKAMREKYAIRTVFVPASLHHVSKKESENSFGSSEIVVSTSTMPEADMIKANLFAMTVQACHHMGLTKYIAMYLYREKGVSYDSFYNALAGVLEQSDSSFRHMRGVYASYLDGKGDLGCIDGRFGNITWFPEELFFLQNLSRLDDFHKELEPLLRRYILDRAFLSELLRWQKLSAVLPQGGAVRAEFSYDFYGYYFGNAGSPEKRNIVIELTPPYYPNWQRCARYTVWYGRRRSGTDAFISAGKISIL